MRRALAGPENSRWVRMPVHNGYLVMPSLPCYTIEQEQALCCEKCCWFNGCRTELRPERLRRLRSLHKLRGSKRSAAVNSGSLHSLSRAIQSGKYDDKTENFIRERTGKI